MGITEAQLKHKMSDTSKKEESGVTDLVIPVARVRRTCKLDPDVKNISKEATLLITKSTELFIAKIADESFKISSLSNRCFRPLPL